MSSCISTKRSGDGDGDGGDRKKPFKKPPPEDKDVADIVLRLLEVIKILLGRKNAGGSLPGAKYDRKLNWARNLLDYRDAGRWLSMVRRLLNLVSVAQGQEPHTMRAHQLQLLVDLVDEIRDDESDDDEL